MKNLRKHLMPLQRRGLITIWSDTDIGAGDAWEEVRVASFNSPHPPKYWSQHLSNRLVFITS